MIDKQLGGLRSAARQLSLVPSEKRSEVLRRFATSIIEDSETIYQANKLDLEDADSLSAVLKARLKFDPLKLRQTVAGIQKVAEMGDPVGSLQERTVLDTGLVLDKVRVPLGVVGVIFESRPDVLPQLISLAMRTANALALKGGQEARRTNEALLKSFNRTLSQLEGQIPSSVLLFHDREVVEKMIGASKYLDLIVPRGSNKLVQQIMNESLVPVLGHADGICHIYVHQSADLDRAVSIVVDAKVQYPTACNAVETVLVDENIAQNFLAKFSMAAKKSMIDLKGCTQTKAILPDISTANDEDYYREYGEPTLNLKIVGNCEQAIDHINNYGSHHTDAIIASDEKTIERFLNAVDSASVFANCSTRFADGYRYGFGAEVGIGTGKLHARGPVGIEGLLTYKYLLRGSGQIVSNYVGETAMPFIHSREIIS